MGGQRDPPRQKAGPPLRSEGECEVYRMKFPLSKGLILRRKATKDLLFRARMEQKAGPSLCSG